MNYLHDLRTPSLIVVDNAETIKDPAVWKFLTELPDPSAAIITTREAPEYGWTRINVDEMELAESVGLFAAETSRVKNDPAWADKLNDDDTRRAVEICSLLDGHPLAILIAAALLRSMNLVTALAQVKANPSRGDVAKRFDFSYNPLPDAEKDLLHRLAAFASHVDPWFIQGICTIPELCDNKPLMTWQTDLIELVRKSFVEHHEFPGKDSSGNDVTASRYRLHPVMRDYAARKASDEAMRRHNFNAAQLLVAFARQFKQNFDALENELPNLLGAMDWANAEWRLEVGSLKLEAARLATQMTRAIDGIPNGLLFLRGYWNEAKRRLMQAAEAARRIGNVEDEAAFMGNAAIVLKNQGDVVSARAELERVKIIFGKINRKDAVAAILHQLAMLAQTTGDLAEASHLYDQSLRLNRELGDKQGIAHTLHNLAAIAQDTGDLAEARRLYNQSLQLARELGDKQGIAQTLHQLAMLAQATGGLAEARRLYDQSLQLERELGYKQGIAKTIFQLGSLLEDKGNLSEALKRYEESMQLDLELQNVPDLAIDYETMSRLLLDAGKRNEAENYLTQAAEIYERLERPDKAKRVRERLEKAGSGAAD